MSASSSAADNSAEEEDDDEDYGGQFAKLDKRRQKDNDEYQDEEDADSDEDDGKDKEVHRGTRQAPVGSVLGKATSVKDDVSSILDDNAFIEVPKDLKNFVFITEHKPPDPEKGWTCRHCDHHSDHWNTTKIKAHLARVSW